MSISRAKGLKTPVTGGVTRTHFIHY